jgi:hypothetical protein
MVKTENAPASHSGFVDKVRGMMKMKDEELNRYPSFDSYRVVQAKRENWQNVWYPGVFEAYAHENDAVRKYLERYQTFVAINGKRTEVIVENLEDLASWFPGVTHTREDMHNSGPGEHFLYQGTNPFPIAGIVVGTNLEDVRLILSGAAIRPELEGDLLRAGMLIARK